MLKYLLNEPNITERIKAFFWVSRPCSWENKSPVYMEQMLTLVKSGLLLHVSVKYSCLDLCLNIKNLCLINFRDLFILELEADFL